MKLCPMCKGAQNLLTFYEGKPEYYDCPCCNHWGVRFAGKNNANIPDTEREKMKA
jgi:hypothetical protein